MSKVLVSAAGPRLQRLLRCSEPTYRRFAAEHGYELVIDRAVDDAAATSDLQARRDARWRKVDLLIDALGCFELVIWVDADAMFRRFDRDIAADVPDGCFQAFVLEQLPTRFNPNTGVWALRRDPQSLCFLREVQRIGQLDHSWTDQAAVCKALGWSLGDFHGHGAKPAHPSPFLARTGWLPPEWNAVGMAAPWPPRVRHFAGMDLDRRLQRMAAELARLRRSGLLDGPLG
ncbi:MAG: hypothetical protein M3N52_05425 [Actinomycetota bacterium]|nr:hypothetical protein [Actinomycetota bacterium]